MNRRGFVHRLILSAGALAAKSAQSATVADSTLLETAPLRILILGGTGFIGPHLVRAALGRGHRVSVFNRGNSVANLPLEVERLTGDRNGDLESIKRRDWDAVLDVAAYVPNWVRTVGAALRGRAKHYTFISTIMAYESPGSSEDQKLVNYTGKIDPYQASSLEKLQDQYGAMKVLCEREAELQFPGRAFIVRPGNIIGPRELVGAFTYWVARMQAGGEVLAAGDPLTPVQLVDVRDLAEWVIRSVEKRMVGAFNVVGPAMQLGWAEMIGAIRGCFSAPTELTWVPNAWLLKQNLSFISAPLFWPSECGTPGMWKFPNRKALNNGLSFRPISTSVADTAAWYKQLPREKQEQALLAFSEGSRNLTSALAAEKRILTAWRKASSN